MRLVINEAKYQENLTIVTGKTTIGTIKGIWKNTENPVIGNKYHVELSINFPHEAHIQPKEKQFPFVSSDNAGVIFGGVCEGFDNEVYYLRFETDWIDMLDINAISSKKQKGDYISFTANYYDIEIYPYTIK